MSTVMAKTRVGLVRMRYTETIFYHNGNAPCSHIRRPRLRQDSVIFLTFKPHAHLQVRLIIRMLYHKP